MFEVAVSKIEINGSPFLFIGLECNREPSSVAPFYFETAPSKKLTSRLGKSHKILTFRVILCAILQVFYFEGSIFLTKRWKTNKFWCKLSEYQ